MDFRQTRRKGVGRMKLTERTTPQAKNYQCDKCKAIKCHKNMYNDDLCYNCYDETQELIKSVVEDE